VTETLRKKIQAPAGGLLLRAQVPINAEAHLANHHSLIDLLGSVESVVFVHRGDLLRRLIRTAPRNHTRDEGRSFEFGNQMLISSQRKLLSPKVAEKSGHDLDRRG
jgi:hypothetical protein